jgi:hypothetical protein
MKQTRPHITYNRRDTVASVSILFANHNLDFPHSPPAPPALPKGVADLGQALNLTESLAAPKQSQCNSHATNYTSPRISPTSNTMTTRDSVSLSEAIINHYIEDGFQNSVSVMRSSKLFL